MQCKYGILCFFLLLSVAFSHSYAAGASGLQGVSGTLKAVEKAIHAAVSQSETLFEQNAGASLPENINIINNNRYLQILQIHTDYKIQLEFAAAPPDLGVDNAVKVPVAQALLSKTIVLIPIFGGYGSEGQAMSSVINSWSCITDADESVETFMGSDTAATAGTISFISTNGNNSDNVYLSECIYLAHDAVMNIVNTLLGP